MDRAVIAALLSALVFPGVGQLYLKRRRRGWLFVLVTLAAAAYFFTPIMGLVLDIASDINTGKLPYDPVAIALRLDDGRQAATPLHTLASLVMIGGWITATVDAWLLGRKARQAP